MADADSSFSFSAAPDPGASAYFRDKSLRPAFRWSEVWGEEHAYAFTIAKAVQLDVLGAIKESLQKAIDEGVPYSTWSKTLQPELERLGWWGKAQMPDPATGEIKTVQLGSPRRLATIYDANLRTARAAGQWERAQRTKAVLPYFSYELGPSIHHRPEHEAREGMIAPVDDAIWNEWYPPNGWGCKCWLRQITRSESDRRGGVTDLGDDESATREFARKRDDGSIERVRVPKGIDPGWASNPGKNRAQTLMTSLQTKLAAADPAAARAALQSLWTSQTAEVLPKLPTRTFAPVAIAPAAVKAAMGADAGIVGVGSGEMAAKIAKHGGARQMRAADFGKVQAVLDKGVGVDSAGRRAYFAELEDGWWVAVLKTAKKGRELILASLHPVNGKRAAEMVQKAKRAEGR